MHVTVCIYIVGISLLCVPLLSNALNAEVNDREFVNRFEQTGHLHARWKRQSVTSLATTCPELQTIVEARIGKMNSSERKLFFDEMEFKGDSKYSLQMSWLGNDTERILVITSEGGISTVYLSDETSKKFDDISFRLGNATVGRELSLWKHPLDSKVVFIVANWASFSSVNSLLYISEDAGNSFQKVVLSFFASGSFTFHLVNPRYVLLDDKFSHKLFFSKDGGHDWQQIKSNVISYKWSTMAESKDILVVTGENFIFTDSKSNVLEKSTDLGQSWSTLYKSVHSFGVGGNFLYTSAYASSDSNERRLFVSTDAGSTWQHVLLPTITPDRFFSILDFSEGQIFLHVDDPGDTGKGTLYVSDATGIAFTKSLENHLYPNFQDVTDFYVVQSMRGVYIANQLLSDNSIHTVISYNRGADWQPIERPKHVACQDETEKCNLQIHNVYSRQHGIRASAPLSVPNAVGIILVHGHIAQALQTSDPDVFVTSDGGYTWRLALKGPHYYAIGDHGGLLVALPADTPTPSVIKFSTNEGRCWISYNFTKNESEPITVTGLLIEPGNKAMMVAIWGYTTERIWHTFFVNFTALIDRQCADSDYEDWVAHSHQAGGCLLGYNETFRRLTPEAWCYNGRTYAMSKTTRPCLCTVDDFDCDFGYMRDENADKCIVDPSLSDQQIPVCLRNHEEDKVFIGYHKIPGDKCQGGFSPEGTSVISLLEECRGSMAADLSSEAKELEPAAAGKPNAGTVLVAVFVICVIIIVAVVITLYARKRMHSQSYYYMSITSDDIQPLNSSNAVNTSVYDNSSDDEPVLS